MEYINFEHNETAAELVRAAYDTPPLAFVHSYGCQQNVNDGERIKGVLVDIGYGLCDKPEDADLILFNTCAVREHAAVSYTHLDVYKRQRQPSPSFQGRALR